MRKLSILLLTLFLFLSGCSSSGRNLNNVQVGDVITFGKNYQMNDKDGKKDDIEWIVLEKGSGKILILSKYILDWRIFDDKYFVTWENSMIREWLNETFFDESFTEEEQAKIQTYVIPADKNPEYDTDPGVNTTDKVFLLSMAEVEEYLPDLNDRICKSTEEIQYDKKEDDPNLGRVWWLRTPGYDENYATYVDLEGIVQSSGMPVDIRNGVRPAMWISIK